MKHRLKKINRGLVLAAVLIVGMVIFIVADNHNFKSEKPQIEQTVVDFVHELAAQNVTPEEYRENRFNYSKEAADKRISGFTALADKYWITVEQNQTLMGWYTFKSNFKDAMQQIIDDTDRGYITECEAELNDCKISKDGPNAAVVQCTVRFIFTGTNNCALIGTGGADWSYAWEESEQDDTLVKYSVEQECTILMQRTADGWKITGNEWYDSSCDQTIVKETDNEQEAA